MPSRTYNILAAGKPILALTENDSEIAQVVEEDKVGWTVLPNEPERLLQKILLIYEERYKFEEIGKNARKSAVEKYSIAVALKKYQIALK